MKYNVISADSHIMEPSDLWLKYLEAKYRDRAPHVERKDKIDSFVCAPLPPAPVGSMSKSGKGMEAAGTTYLREEMRPGGWEPEARVKDMLLDGVDAEVLYPTFGIILFKLEDQPFLQAVTRSYNDWAADFASVYPDRFKVVAMLPTDDIDWACKELRRVAKKGLKGAMVPGSSQGEKGYQTKHFDRLWAVAEELDLPMSLHVGADRQKKELDSVKYFSTYGTAPHFIAESVLDMVFSGVFERFPKLKIVSAENDVCWIANVLQRVDGLYMRRRHLLKNHFPNDALPSDVFRQHVFATFIRDNGGIKAREEIGIGNIMWSSDYPHPACTWPNSQRDLANHFAGVPAADRNKIVCENAKKLYGFS